MAESRTLGYKPTQIAPKEQDYWGSSFQLVKLVKVTQLVNSEEQIWISDLTKSSSANFKGTLEQVRTSPNTFKQVETSRNKSKKSKSF